MTEIVATFQRNKRESVRVQWSEYEGVQYLDLRTFYDADGELKPTRKGITVRPDQVGQLIDALERARVVGRKLGLDMEGGA